MAAWRWLALVGCALSWTGLARAADLVLVETPFSAAESAVVVRDLSSGRERRVASLPHAPGYGAAGSLSPDGRLLAVTVLASGNRLWQHASVFAVDLDGGTAPRRLLDEAVFGAPAWTAPGDVLAVRSVGEHQPAVEDARAGRLMDLDLEVVSLGRGEPKVVLRDRCYSLELVGAMSGGEMAIVRSAWEGNSLIALRPDGNVRRVAELGSGVAAWPHRSPDGLGVVFQQVIDRREGLLAISRIELDGKRRDLARTPVPFSSPVPVAGGVALISADGQSIGLLDATGHLARTLMRDPNAQRLVPVRASSDGKLLIVETVGEGPARTQVVDVESGKRSDAGGASDRWREAMGLRRLP